MSDMDDAPTSQRNELLERKLSKLEAEISSLMNEVNDLNRQIQLGAQKVLGEHTLGRIIGTIGGPAAQDDGSPS
jgi:SMC interacting uncharacterized protein involved in chromosome segregation